jgi:hypothetical protein
MSATATAVRAHAAAPARPSPARGVPQREAPARRAHLRIVEEPGRRARRRRTFAIIGGVAVLALLTVVAFQAFLAQSQVAIDRLEHRTAVAERRYEQARYEHARLSAPQRIVERARALGLVAPDAPPTAITVAGEAPAPPDASSPTLRGVAEVKATLGTGP